MTVPLGSNILVGQEGEILLLSFVMYNFLSHIPGVPFIRWAMTFSTQNHRITITDFRPCLICQSYSQANIYYYALKLLQWSDDSVWKWSSLNE